MATKTRWLDAEEQQAWRHYIRAVRLVDEHLRKGLEEHDLSHPEYEILVRLSEVPDRALRMSELAAEVVNSRSRLTHTVSRLERAGWVRRRPSCSDGRGVECQMTEQGFAALEKAAATHVEGVRSHLLDPLTREEFLALGAAMAKVGALAEQHQADACPVAGAQPGMAAGADAEGPAGERAAS